MIYIIEGIDGSGKTTLANKLAVMTKANMIHFSQPKSESNVKPNVNTMLNMYQDLLKRSNNLIIDRCWYSEMCYGPVMRGKSMITYPQMYELERLAANKGAIIIYCTDSKAALWNRIKVRGEDYITSRDHFNEIYENYEVLFSLPHILPVMRYSIAYML